MNGGYTDWTSWSSCSETCGQQSIQMRMRICMNPRPQYGGKDCPGSRFKIRHCTMPSCQEASVAEELWNSRGKSKDLDDSNVLESLKTILQSKTSSLEDRLSNEPENKASKLFDTIYQSGDDIAGSNKVENTSKTNGNLFEDHNRKPVDDNLPFANKVGPKISTASTANVLLNRSANALTDTKLDQPLLNKNRNSPVGDKKLVTNENLSSNEKVGALSVHFKSAKDASDLEQLPTAVGNPDNGLSSQLSESIENPVKTRQANIFGKTNVDGTLVRSPLRGSYAWKSEGWDRKLESKNARVLPPANDSSVTKFDSIFVDDNKGDVMETGNETMATEIHAQNYLLNASPSSEFETSETKGVKAHTMNPMITKERRLLDTKPNEHLNSQTLNGSSATLKSPTRFGTKQIDDHVQGIFPKHAARDNMHDELVDNHVQLRTSTVSVTDNGTSVSSVMGVIRYKEDGKYLSSKGDIDKTTDTNTIRIHDNGEWSPWSICSSSCGRGYRTRSKQICLQLPTSKENECTHVKVQKKSCMNTPCQEILTEPQTRLVEVQKLQGNDVEGLTSNGNILLAGQIPKVENAATGRKHATEIMGLVRQELDADFLPWSLWSVCSLTCGTGGIRTRTRRCQNSKKPNCIGASRENKTCFVEHCPVKGEWSMWSQWTSCSQSCGKSVKLRMRQCDNPAPLYGGEKCNGDAVEKMKCDVPACPVNGHWSLWSAWSTCSVTCGKALRQRTRSCDNPPPSNGGLTCMGKSLEHLGCYLPACPIDGDFSHWQVWSKCHKSCGENSFRTRFRFCNNPPPSDGGKTCRGNRLQVSKCLSKPCTEPVNGGFSPWSNWSSCSQDCHLGSVKLRTRMCDSPKPLYGGLDCAGDDTEYKNCSVDECKVDGGLSDWSAWGACSQSCGDAAIRSRERTCTNPPPAGGGRNCSGETFEIKLCKMKSCHQEVATPTPILMAKNEQTDSPLVQTIMDEKEQLLTEKKSGNDGVFSELKKKLIENLKKLAPDLGLSLGTGNTTTNEGKTTAKEVKNLSKYPVNPTQAVTEVLNDADSGLSRKLGAKGNVGDTKEQLEDPDDESQDDKVEKTIDPIKSCGVNPCLLAKCLSDPFADCSPNIDCDPVYYDSSGKVKEDCNVETTFLTVPASQLCGQDPCQVSTCLKMPMTKCLTSALCKPVYFDETGSVFNCTGVLKTPVRMTCRKDPCMGKLCPVDAQAKCFTDYDCKSTFWNLNFKEEIAECKEPDLEPLEADEENADQRSQTPFPHRLQSRNRLHRPWLRLSKSALNAILKHSPSNEIYITQAKLKHLRGTNKLSLGHSGLTMTLHEHNDSDPTSTSDDDPTSTSDDDMNNSDEHDNNDMPFSKPTKAQYSLSGVLPNKLKQFNNPRKNPILTLTSLNADQYQSQGGSGVSVTKDWKLKLRPPIHLNGYVESPQVYKVNMQKHDKDQSAEEYLLHHQDKSPLSEGLSSQGLDAEGLNSEVQNAEGLTSEGKISDRMPSEGLNTADLTPEKLALERLRSDGGLNPEGLTSEGLHEGNMRFTPEASTLNGIDRLLKSDEAHVGGIDIARTRTLTPIPYEKVLKQDISDIQSALSNADGQIPGEDKLSGLESPVIHQGLTASLRSPEIEKENQINLAGLEAPRGIVTQGAVMSRVTSPRAIPADVPPDYLPDSKGGQYVPLDSVIDNLRAHVEDNPSNNNLGFR